MAQRAFGFVVRRLDAIIVKEPEAGLGVGFDPLGQRLGLRPRLRSHVRCKALARPEQCCQAHNVVGRRYAR